MPKSSKAVADSRWQLKRGHCEFVQAGGMRPQREQRSDERIVSVFRLAKLIGDQEEFCLIRNISAGGLKAEVFSPKAEGDAVAIDFGDGKPRPAQVRWVQDECVGLAFDEKINVAQTLMQVPAPLDRRARRLRLLLEVRAFVLLPKQRTECQVIDVSQGGAKIRTNLSLEVGERMRLEMDSLGIISGIVRWVRDSHAGIAFATPIPYREMARWIAAQTPPQTPPKPPTRLPRADARIPDMDESNPNSPRRHVIGPLGTSLTVDDLPPPGLRRWVMRCKAEVVAAVDGGLLSLDEACERYDLSIEELAGWQRAVEHFGMRGLRATRVQEYKSAYRRKQSY